MRSIQFFLFAAMATIVACGGSHGSDGGDVVMTTDAQDARPNDTGSPGTCGTPINLNTAALHTSSGLSYMGDDSMAAVPPMRGLPTTAPSCVNPMNAASYEVVFSYTMQAAGALRVSTDNPGTDTMEDTIVFVVDGCRANGHELGCNDDVNTATDRRSTAFTVPLMAGQTVMIVVGAYNYMGNTMTGGFSMDGPFQLTVSEVMPQATGASCDLSSNPVCVIGSDCIASTVGGTAGTCLAEGSLLGNCNTTGMACNAGLACTNPMPMPGPGNTGQCQTPITAMGGACSWTDFLCPTGQSCPIDPANPMNPFHCTNNGTAEFTACATTGTPCTGMAPGGMPLGCTAAMPTTAAPGVCLIQNADGANCTTQDPVCIAGDTCILTTATMGTCKKDGSSGGVCRATAPQCDPGLTCNTTTNLCM